MKNLKLLDDRVLVRPFENQEKKTESGIILQVQDQEELYRGEVLEVGPGTDETKMQVAKGDLIIYGKYSGTEMTVEIEGKEEKVILFRQNDILAIYEN